jgi:hypothetical protein
MKMSGQLNAPVVIINEERSGIHKRGSQVGPGTSFDEVTETGNPAPIRNKIIAVLIELTQL